MLSLQVKINTPLNVKPGTHTAQADNMRGLFIALMRSWFSQIKVDWCLYPASKFCQQKLIVACTFNTYAVCSCQIRMVGEGVTFDQELSFNSH